MDITALSRIFAGLAKDGSWAVLNGFHRYSYGLLSIVHHYTNTIYQALKMKSDSALLQPFGQVKHNNVH